MTELMNNTMKYCRYMEVDLDDEWYNRVCKVVTCEYCLKKMWDEDESDDWLEEL